MRSDRVLMFLNLVLLLWTSLLPFPTALVARYLSAGGPNAPTAEALYSISLTLAALAFSLVWFRAAHRNRLVDAAPAAALAIQFLLALYYLFEQVRPANADAETWGQLTTACVSARGSG